MCEPSSSSTTRDFLSSSLAVMRVGPATHRVIKAHDSDDEEEDFGGLLCHGEVSHAPPPALYGGNGGPGGSAHPRVTAYADAGHFKVGRQRGTPAVHRAVAGPVWTYVAP